jgi:hypothetical protein
MSMVGHFFRVSIDSNCVVSQEMKRCKVMNPFSFKRNKDIPPVESAAETTSTKIHHDNTQVSQVDLRSETKYSLL